MKGLFVLLLFLCAAGISATGSLMGTRASPVQIAPTPMGKTLGDKKANTFKIAKLQEADEAAKEEMKNLEKRVKKNEEKQTLPGPAGKDGSNGKDGVDGAPGKRGERGLKGEKGEKGNDGVGLHLKEFKLGDTYSKGDYVFDDSSKGNHHSMFIAKHSFIAKQRPKNDHPNWDEFEAPRGEKGEKGDSGADGRDGEKGERGDTGNTGSPGARGAAGAKGARGPQGPINQQANYMTMHNLRDKKYSKVMWQWEGGKSLVLRSVGAGGDARWHITGMNTCCKRGFPGGSVGF